MSGKGDAIWSLLGLVGHVLDAPLVVGGGGGPCIESLHVVQDLDRVESRIPALDEIRSQVYEDLYARKSREIQEHLLEFLQKEYDVVIHQSSLTDGAEGAEAGDGS